MSDGQTGRSVIFKPEHGRCQCQCTVILDCEYLNEMVVHTSDQQKFSVRSDHKIAGMPAGTGISDLLQCTVCQGLEYRNSVIVQTMGGV